MVRMPNFGSEVAALFADVPVLNSFCNVFLATRKEVQLPLAMDRLGAVVP